jgi:histidinol-phosphate phosphatase family protein
MIRKELKVKQAVISAGGKGTRLNEVINNLPKILAVVGGITLLERHLENLDSWEIEECVLLLGHDAGMVEDFLSEIQGRYKVKVSTLKEEEPLGTGGAIINAFNELHDSFIYFHGDLFINLPKDNFRLLFDPIADFALFVHSTNHPEDSDLVEFDVEKIIRFLTKPHTVPLSVKNFGNAGLYFFYKNVFKDLYIPTKKVDLDREIIPKLLSIGFQGRAIQNRWEIRDVGTPQRYLKTNLDIDSGKLGRKKRPAILLDRDGTINLELGHITSPVNFHLVKGAAEGIKMINEAGVLVIIVTNQPVIARGELSYSGLDLIHAKMELEIGAVGATIDGIYVCPHHPDKGFLGEAVALKIECDCRKPKAGLIERAVAEFGIDKELCVLIGDTWRDKGAASNGGIKFQQVSEVDGQSNILEAVKASLNYVRENWSRSQQVLNN